MRGVARETAIAYGLPLRDPALLDVPAPNAFGYPVKIADPIGCDRFTARTVVGLDPEARSPIWLQRRLQKAGMRPISLAVDITNYVMLELGQPLHAYDRTRIDGPIGVRRAQQGEKLTTLDGTVSASSTPRTWSSPTTAGRSASRASWAAPTPRSPTSQNGEDSTTEVVIEAAHFDAISIARTARRHKLSSEASKRFERGVDPQAAAAAAQRTVDLLVLLAGGTAEAGVTEVIAPSAPRTIAMPADHPDRVAGVEYGRETVVRRLQEVGCDVYGQDELLVTVPSWRPDLSEPNDLAEEVIRLEGYENLPSTLPTPPSGRGLTDRQRLHRRVGRALAGAGYVEALNYPFIGDAVLDQLGLDADDARRRTVKLVNPLSDEEPALRTTLLPGLLGALRRNDGRGSHDLALFETGLVFRPTGDETQAVRLPVDRRPTDEEIAGLNAALPRQPRRAAVVLAGAREQAGWWGKGRPADWADSVEAARTIAREAGVELIVRSDQHAPWHPGRCAALFVTVDGEETLVGHAGELHPRVIKALAPAGAHLRHGDRPRPPGAGRRRRAPGAADLHLPGGDPGRRAGRRAGRAGRRRWSRRCATARVNSSNRCGCSTSSPASRSARARSRWRTRCGSAPPDRTLTVDEATAARDAAVALAAERTGAVLRGA